MGKTSEYLVQKTELNWGVVHAYVKQKDLNVEMLNAGMSKLAASQSAAGSFFPQLNVFSSVNDQTRAVGLTQMVPNLPKN